MTQIKELCLHSHSKEQSVKGVLLHNILHSFMISASGKGSKAGKAEEAKTEETQVEKLF